METRIDLRLTSDREEYSAGDTLRGLVAWDEDASMAGELSVLWHTEGKGDMDTGIIHFEEVTLDNGREHGFEVMLPLLPLTYYGKLLKIHWVIRVRVDKKWGKDILFELPFVLRSPSAVSEPPQHA